MLQMALCDERLVALTSREVGVKVEGCFGWRFFRTTTIQIQTVKMKFAFPMCSFYPFGEV